MSEIQRLIENATLRVRQIETEQGRTLTGLGNQISRETTLMMEFLTSKLRAMETLHADFLKEAEELRNGVLTSAEKLLDLEVQLRHEALKMAPELDHVDEEPKQITDGTGDQGMILEMGETVERRKRKAAG